MIAGLPIVLAALLLENPSASTVVLAEMVSMVIVSALVLTLVYRPYERAMLAHVNWTVDSSRNLVFFAILILIVPIALLLI